ncbi:relaxin receptor 2-like, partial [Anneissia japonica]|uniref:relaxin receptor 2-like n=1 Tax=Anneissia japonica TaxID=1529436 RepID=UPI001425795E
MYSTGLLNYVSCDYTALPLCEKNVSNICPQEYNCRNSSVCLPYDKLCDGLKNCLEGDDEYFCDYTCPAECTCKDFRIKGNKIEWNSTIIIKLSLTDLDLSGKKITDLLQVEFNGLINLRWLDLSGNEITDLLEVDFNGLINLQWLFLHFNQITELNQGVFSGLTSLQT